MTSEEKDELNLFFKDRVFIFRELIFPERKDRDLFDYFKILEVFKGIHFDACDLHISDLSIKGKMFFFQSCKFYNNWNLYNLSTFDDLAYNSLYQECIFMRDLCSFPLEADNYLVLKHPLFVDCHFSNIRFRGTLFESKIFCDTN